MEKYAGQIYFGQSLEITADSSSLHVLAGIEPEPLVSECKSLTTKLRVHNEWQ